MMRRRDWADIEAERLYDLVRDAADDDLVIAETAKSLRKAAQDFNDVITTGPIGPKPSLV